MRTIVTEADIDALHGEVESSTLEIKGVDADGRLKKTEKIVETIQSFINGAEDGGHIIIGLHENANQEVDRNRKCPIRFPAAIKDMNFKPESFAAYRDHLMKMLRGSTENYTEGLCKVDKIRSGDQGDFIIISVNQGILRPHRNTNGHYYIRRTEGRTDRMSTVEVETEILQKEIRLQALRSGLTPKKNEPIGETFGDNPFSGGKPIAFLMPFGNRDKAREIKLMEGAEEFLWLIPTVPIGQTWTAQELKGLIYGPTPLSPLGRITGSWNERNEFGAIVFQESNVNLSIALNLSQVFTDGRILGVDRFMLNAERQKEFSGAAVPYIPSQAFEEDFENGLQNFMSFMSKVLNIPPPYKFRAGLAGVKGYAVAVPKRYDSPFQGNMLHDKVEYGALVGGEENIQTALLPFFKKVWSDAGLVRPRNHRFPEEP